MKIVNALGEPCPIPVVKTKNAIKELTTSGNIKILVDNEIAVQNIEKMAKQKNYTLTTNKVEDGNYEVILYVQVEGSNVEIKDTQTPLTDTLVVIDSDKMGLGIDELGEVLMKGFLFAITKQEELPNTIIFYNGGAKLTCEGSDSLEDLKYLESQNVEILTCGTCLNYHNLEDKLKVGDVTNMYSIVEIMSQCKKMIKP